MKKIIIFIALIAVIPILWGVDVKAYTQDQLILFKQEYNAIYNVNATDTFYSKVLEIWENNTSYPNNNKLYTYNEGGNYLGFDLCNSNTRINGTSFSMVSGDTTSVRHISNINRPNASDFGFSNTNYTGTVRNCNPYYWGTFEEWLNGHIDFDNVYYSPMVATPILTPYYTAYNETGINIPYVPLTFDLSNPNESYYLQIKQKNYTPSVVRVDGANKFNVQARNGFDVHDIYEMSDLIVSSDFSRNDFYDDISDNWMVDLNEFVFSNVQMINGLQSTIGSTADAYFLAQTTKYQQLRNIQTVYGNIIEIWARYFMIDENNNVVVGKWYHWWSLASDSFDEQLPEYVIPYEKAYGTENTTDQNNAPNGVGTTNGTGTSSNPNQNYTYVSVVPNYPDYPTIASYNKDNLLVDTITKMNDTKVFFGEFNNFLQASFVWVPNWIWGIIGVGFALSIIVFFLRML